MYCADCQIEILMTILLWRRVQQWGRQCATGHISDVPQRPQITHQPTGDKSPRSSEQTVLIHTAAQHLEFGMLAETGKQ